MPLFSGISKPFYRDSFTFTQVGSSGIIDLTKSPIAIFSLSAKGTGASPTAWGVKFEGSLDGVNWTGLLSHSTTTGDGVIVSTGNNDTPVDFIRVNVGSLTLGTATNLVVKILGLQ